MAATIHLKIFLLFAGLHLLQLTFAQQVLLGIPKGHTAEVYQPTYSVDGNYILTPSADNTAKVWEARTGRLLHNLLGHSKQVIYAEFTSDNKKIITAGDNSIIIWDAALGAVIKHLRHGNIPTIDFENLAGQIIYTSSITSITKSPDNKLVVSAARDSTIIVWDIQKGEAIKRKKIQGEPNDIIFKKDNRQVIILTDNGEISTWNINDDTFQKNTFPDVKNISKIQLSPDEEKLLILTNTDGSLMMGNIKTGKVDYHVSRENRLISVQWFPDGSKFIGTGRDSCFIWDAKTGRRITTISGHSGWINTARANRTGNTIITAGRDQLINIWGPAQNKPVHSISAHLSYINAIIFSPNGKEFVSSSNDGTAIIWNTASGTMLHKLAGAAQNVFFGKISPDKNYFLTAAGDNLCRIWDLKSGRVMSTLKGHSSWVYYADISHDNQYIVTTATDNTAKIWKRETGEMIQTLKGHTNTINHATFDKAVTNVVTASEDKTARIWEISSGKEKFILNHEGQVKTASYSPDEKKILTTSFDRTAKLWDPSTGKAIATMKGHTSVIRKGVFNPDGNYFATASGDQTAILWDAANGNYLRTFSGHSDFVYNIGFNKQGRKLYTAALDSTLKIWNPENAQLDQTIGLEGASVKSIFPSDDGTQLLLYRDNAFILCDSLAVPQVSIFFNDSLCLLYTPKGYYMGDKQMIRKLYYRQGLKTLGFDQLDIKFNRPDKVLQALNSKDTLLVNAYRKAWEKRIRKLGIDTAVFSEKFSLPTVDILNIDNINYEQTSEKISIHIKGNDDAFLLDRLNIWVNEVPMFGQHGILLRQKKINTLDTILNIPLSIGKNTIEVSIVNSNGSESYRAPLRLNYIPKSPKATTTYFIGIGVDDYKNNNQNLQFCIKDIRDLSRALKAKHGKNIVIDTLFNKEVTVDALSKLKSKLLSTGINDRVIVSYSGHGVLNKDFDYFLGTYEINFNEPSEGGLPYTFLEELLDSIPARQKLLLLDACHSGEVDKEEKDAIEKTLPTGAKGIKLGKIEQTQPRLGLKNSFELMQELFVNVHKGTGATIISAAAGTQYALELGDLENGVFTYSILEAMKTSTHMRVSALKNYVGIRVSALTNGAQKPTSRNETLEADWDVW